eukprot:scaffold20662_cov25-Tisochrysis_lutea.AAC.2
MVHPVTQERDTGNTSVAHPVADAVHGAPTEAQVMSEWCTLQVAGAGSSPYSGSGGPGVDKVAWCARMKPVVHMLLKYGPRLFEPMCLLFLDWCRECSHCLRVIHDTIMMHALKGSVRLVRDGRRLLGGRAHARMDARAVVSARTGAWASTQLDPAFQCKFLLTAWRPRARAFPGPEQCVLDTCCPAAQLRHVQLGFLSQLPLMAHEHH